VTIPTTAINPPITQVTTAYQVQPNISAPAQIGIITTVSNANPDPRRAITLSNEGRMIPPATASTAKRILIDGRMNRFLLSQTSWLAFSGSLILVAEKEVSGPGSEVQDGEGELGRVTYRGVGTELGT
jgi:hypothetical protein